jgi:hypothetical protein
MLKIRQVLFISMLCAVSASAIYAKDSAKHPSKDSRHAPGPTKLAPWDEKEEADNNRKLLDSSICTYRNNKDQADDSGLTEMRIVTVGQGVCGKTNASLCVGRIYCSFNGMPFSLPVACPTIGKDQCPEAKACAKVKTVNISSSYRHKSNAGPQHSGPGITDDYEGNGKHLKKVSPSFGGAGVTPTY